MSIILLDFKPIWFLESVINAFKIQYLLDFISLIESMQKAIGLLQEIGIGKTTKVDAPYEARPMYKYFED